MTYDDFYRLRLDALDCASADQLVAEEGGSVDCRSVDNLIRDLTYIYEVRTISDIRASTGLSRAAFCREYGIPLRTMEDWEAGRSTPPDYVVSLLAYAVMGGDQK